MDWKDKEQPIERMLRYSIGTQDLLDENDKEEIYNNHERLLETTDKQTIKILRNNGIKEEKDKLDLSDEQVTEIANKMKTRIENNIKEQKKEKIKNKIK